MCERSLQLCYISLYAHTHTLTRTQGGLVPSSIIFFLIMVVSVVVGFLLFSSKRYCGELYPGMAVWGYEDLALAAFGPIGKV